MTRTSAAVAVMEVVVEEPPRPLQLSRMRPAREWRLAGTTARGARSECLVLLMIRMRACRTKNHLVSKSKKEATTTMTTVCEGEGEKDGFIS